VRDVFALIDKYEDCSPSFQTPIEPGAPVSCWPFANATIFKLAKDGFDSITEQRVSCPLSIRTYHDLFACVRISPQISRLTLEKIGGLIHPSHVRKKFSRMYFSSFRSLSSIVALFNGNLLSLPSRNDQRMNAPVCIKAC
jgi:hypothetical protein